MYAVLILFYQAGAGAGGAIVSFLPLVLIFAIFYFLLFLPSQRRQRQLQEMLKNLKNGDRVVTTGGLRGTIVALRDEAVHLQVPPQSVRLEIARNAVAGLLQDEDKKTA